MIAPRKIEFISKKMENENIEFHTFLKCNADENELDEKFVLPFDIIPVRFPGTGDIFSSILIGKVLSGNRLVDSTRNAMDAVRELIKRNQDNADKYKGIPVENYLEVLD